MASRSYTALIGGGLACALVALVWSSRAERAIAAEIGSGISNQVYAPIANAEGQARLLASNTEIREGLAERNRIRLRGAIRQSLPQMKLSYVGVLLPDGTPYYWLPDHERTVPIVARRLPIERELRTVGTLEYGVMLTADSLAQLASELSTDVQLADNPPAPPADAGGFSNVVLGGEFGYAYLRAPDTAPDPPGAIVAVLQFRLPANSPGAARMRSQRNLLLALVAGCALLVVGYDARQRRRLAQPLPPFTPIQNPYIVGNPIRTAEMFFGREDDLQYVRHKLASERAGSVVVFCGERRSGKTSILFQILNGRLGPEFLPILLDMQYFAAISRDQDFYETVGKEIVRASYPEDEQSLRQRSLDLPSDSAAQSFEVVLDEAMSAHQDKMLLFLFDEYEILESKIERGELSRMVIPYLAGLLERKGRISFIFTGSRNLEERPGQHWRLMLSKSLYRKISYLTRQDAERLIRQPVQGSVGYDAGAVSTICRLTSGQPFYTQVICQNLIDHLNDVKRSTVTGEDVLATVDAIVDNPLPQMIYFWDSLPAEEQIALSLLAEALKDESSWSTASQMMAAATGKGVPVGSDVAALESALDRLFEQEVLAKSNDRMFQYRVDLLRCWIVRTHSIWQVVKEAGSRSHGS